MEGCSFGPILRWVPDLLGLLRRIDAMGLDYGGTINLTKGSRLSVDLFRRRYQNRETFQEISGSYGTIQRCISLHYNESGS
jgi:hypothetical protein